MKDLKQIQEFFGPPADVNTAYRVDFTRIKNKEVIKDFELFKDLEKAKSKFEQLKKDPFMGSIKIEKIYGGQSGDGDRYLGGSEEIGSYSNPVNNTKSSELTDEENDIKIYMTSPSFISAKRGYKEKEDLMAYLGRRKKATSDFVNDTLEEMDINDPVLVKARAAKMKANQPKKSINPNFKAVKNASKIAFLKKERAQLMRDMEQEAEPEGGPIADEYGSKLNRIDAAIAKLEGRKEMTYDQAIAEDEDKDSNIVPEAELILPRGKKAVLQAEDTDYKRGLIVELLNNGGYEMAYWYDKPDKPYPVEILVDGQSIKPDGKVVEMKFHPQDYYDEQDKLNEVTRYSGFLRNPPEPTPDSEPFNPTGAVAEFREDLRALFGKFKDELNNRKFIGGVAEVMVNWKSLLRSQMNESINLSDYNEDMEKVIKRGIKRINIGSSDEEDLLYYVHNNWMGGNITAEEAMKKISDYLSPMKENIDEGDTYEKMAAKGKKAGNLKQGTVRKRLNIPKGEKIPISLIKKEISRIKKMDNPSEKNKKYLKALNLAKTLKTTTNVNEMEAKEFVKTVNDEFDLETLELMKKVIDSRVELLNKMKDVANPRTVVKGFRRYNEVAETIKFIKENNPTFTKEEVIAELKVIKKLGESLTEELCAAGKAYRKRRMAAGEKSSAYLSGRAVKVCKGQMSGRKKKKKK